MEAEERPAKIRKLGHESHGQELSQDLSRDAADDHKRPPVNIETIEPSNGTTTHGSSSVPLEVVDAEIVEAASTHAPQQATFALPDTSGLSKNQLKKLRKKQEWEAGREERKIVRKEKLQEKKARKRAARDAATEGAEPTNGEAVEDGEQPKQGSSRPGVPKYVHGTLLPVTFVIDCAFDGLMHDRERISLASQITRSYSDNHRALFKAHLVISSWGGELRKRFDTLLSQHYKKWRGVKVLEEDFVEAAERSKGWMRSERGGRLAGTFTLGTKDLPSHDLEAQGEVVYLTSDSENTLDRLKPYSAYIIGGLVDKNRHKGICYKSACDRGIKTAKLPIGEYMDMQSRYVLATNHVVEIMVRWLECGDWGEAFLKVMPRRKGGKLKDNAVVGSGGENGVVEVGDDENQAEQELEEAAEVVGVSDNQDDKYDGTVAEDEESKVPSGSLAGVADR
jgi:tRNA (guanine9-N1)-methyltransferase